MLLDIKKFYTTFNDKKEYPCVFDFTDDTFYGHHVAEPVEIVFCLEYVNELFRLSLDGQFCLHAECARCLEPVSKTFLINNTYEFSLSDLQNSDSELTFLEESKLDLREVAKTEIEGIVPLVLLCSENCQGLCQYCGKPKALGCSCEQNPVDERLAVLKQLLS